MPLRSTFGRSSPGSNRLSYYTGRVDTSQLGKVDRAADRPPYKQIADQLRKAVDEGVFPADERLPSESDLTRHYKVARMTARAAVAILIHEGRAHAWQGKGVFVTRAEKP